MPLASGNAASEMPPPDATQVRHDVVISRTGEFEHFLHRVGLNRGEFWLLGRGQNVDAVAVGDKRSPQTGVQLAGMLEDIGQAVGVINPE